jgi:hypothetical protein
MRAIGTRGSRAALVLLLLAVAATLFVAPAEAQVSPLWDHYKVYLLNPPIPAPVPSPPVVLTDQFGTFTHQLNVLERFMNPVQKIHPPNTYPITDSTLHYSWWLITPQPFNVNVAVTNQFGDQGINVLDAQYLLNPALKNQHGTPPIKNHYKAYNCTGQPVNVPIGMIDQFDSWQATVMFPRYFLTPVQKQIGGPGGVTYPIVDPNQHYVCYEFQPYDPTPFTAVMTDQFLQDATMQLFPGQMICVPTYKQSVTSAVKDTWGRLKLLYR